MNLSKRKIWQLRLTNLKRTLILVLLIALLSVACGFRQESGTSQRSRPAKPHIATESHVSASDQEALLRLCTESDRKTNKTFFSGEDLIRGDVNAWQQVAEGIEHARKLLPLAKQLTIATLREHQADFQLESSDLAQAVKYIEAVNSVVLDEDLDNVAEVDDEDPNKIHIGPEYALYLKADEESILLLSHELTHVAAWSDKLDPFIESAAERARLVAGVSPTEEQKEDLACDYIGAQALKQFIRLRPNKESAARRLSLALGNGCEAGATDDVGDEEHLSEGDTLRALIGLDPDLKVMILHN